MIDLLNELAALVAQSSSTAQDVADKLGRVVGEERGQLMIETDFTSYATAVPEYDSDELGFVQLVFNEPLALEALQAAFGEYLPVPPMPKKPNRVMFRPDVASESHRATIIAEIEEQAARTFTIRRDILLE
jgi:hypothetical protein